MNIIDKSSSAGASAIPREASDGQVVRGIGAILQTWKIPALVGSAVLVLLLAAIVALRVILPTTTTYVARFQLVFPGIEFGIYPSGLPFSMNEIIEPVILARIYDQFHVDQFDVDRADFYHAFSVRPYTPTEGEIAERFRQQLADRRLSFVERERIEAQLKSSLDLASRTAAEITLTLRRRVGIPDDVGRSIVQAVPLAWSQFAIENKGVLRLPGYWASKTLIASEAPENSSLPVAIVMLLEASDRLASRLAELKKISGLTAMREPQSDKSLRDIEREYRDLEFFHINLLHQMLLRTNFDQGSGTVQFIIERRLRGLEQLESETAKMAAAVGETASQYVNAIVGLKGRVTDRQAFPGAEQGMSGGLVIPQVTEGFFDKIVELSKQGISRQGQTSDQAFIAEMTRRQLDLNERVISYRVEQDRWKELLAALRSDASVRQDLDAATKTSLIRDLRKAVVELNEKWATLSRLEAEFEANRVGHTARLFRSYAIPRDVIRSHPVWNMAMMSAALSLAIILFIVLWAIAIALNLWRGIGTRARKAERQAPD